MGMAGLGGVRGFLRIDFCPVERSAFRFNRLWKVSLGSAVLLGLAFGSATGSSTDGGPQTGGGSGLGVGRASGGLDCFAQADHRWRERFAGEHDPDLDSFGKEKRAVWTRSLGDGTGFFGMRNRRFGGFGRSEFLAGRGLGVGRRGGDGGLCFGGPRSGSARGFGSVCGRLLRDGGIASRDRGARDAAADGGTDLERIWVDRGDDGVRSDRGAHSGEPIPGVHRSASRNTGADVRALIGISSRMDGVWGGPDLAVGGGFPAGFGWRWVGGGVPEIRYFVIFLQFS